MKMHSSHNPLVEDIRIKVCGALNITLATTTDLQIQLKQAHWNIKGPTFYSLHLLFDEIAGELSESADEVAERITSLGGTAYGTLQNAADNTLLEPYPNDIFTASENCTALVKRMGIYCKHLTQHIRTIEDMGDTATSDLYIQLVRQYEKRLWFIEAQLQ